MCRYGCQGETLWAPSTLVCLPGKAPSVGSRMCSCREMGLEEGRPERSQEEAVGTQLPSILEFDSQYYEGP